MISGRDKRRRKMRKLFFILAIALSFALTSIAYSADEALSPEKLSGIWRGDWKSDQFAQIQGVSTMPGPYDCRILITASLNAVFYCTHSLGGRTWDPILDGHGEIINNQLIIHDLANPDKIRMKAYITSKNRLEGETYNFKGALLNFNKIRDLTNEERQHSLSQLQNLLK